MIYEYLLSCLNLKILILMYLSFWEKHGSPFGYTNNT